MNYLNSGGVFFELHKGCWPHCIHLYCSPEASFSERLYVISGKGY